ncbi:MAG TPA: sensor histidine kinase [Streptosporangiaceae bacterium]|nr:sensor histidine kinase [Streptosporangiaceae bacterium]
MSARAGRWAAVAHAVLRPPLREAPFWAVQAVVVGLAAAHLVVDWASPPLTVPAGIPVALLLAPVSYAALRYGLAGSVATAAWGALLWLPDLLLPHDRGHVANDLIELALVMAVAVFVGYHIDSEGRERARARRFAGLLLQAQEDERKRIARGLHDEPLQLLVALARSLERLEGTPGAGAALVGGLGGARQQTLDVAARLRAVVAGLRPPALEQLGLVAALRGLLASIGESDEVDAELHVTGTEVRLPPDTELAAFRIAQEAVTNVVRHAGTSRLELRLTFANGAMSLCVADHGRGFDLAGLDQRPGGGHLGLLGMRERAALRGGRLTVRTAPGQGTAVEVTFSADGAQEHTP